MQKLIILFIVYAFFVTISMVSGYAVELISPLYSKITTGTLLLISSLAAILLFLFDTRETT